MSRKHLGTFGDPQRPSSWVRYRQGMCEGCQAGCCQLPVEVSVKDLIRLGLTDEFEAGSSLKKLAQRLRKEKVIARFQPATQIFILDQRANGDCTYLHRVTRLCTVYEKRPEVCRRFPRVGPRPGWCPGKAPVPQGARKMATKTGKKGE